MFLVMRVDAISILAVFWFSYGRGGQRCATAAASALVLFSVILAYIGTVNDFGFCHRLIVEQKNRTPPSTRGQTN